MINQCTEEDEQTIDKEILVIRSTIEKIIPKLDDLVLSSESSSTRNFERQRSITNANFGESNSCAKSRISRSSNQTKSNNSGKNEILTPKRRRRRPSKKGLDQNIARSPSNSNSIISIESSNNSNQRPFMSPENYLILKLLQLNLFEREKLLIQLAKERKILILNKSTQQFEINQHLLHLPSEDRNLIRGSGNLERLLYSMKITPSTSSTNVQKKPTQQKALPSKKEQKRVEYRKRQIDLSRKYRPVTFEDQVNFLIYGTQLNGRLLLKNKNLSIDNHSFLTKQNQENLFEFIETIVSSKLGTIEKGIIRINAKNSHESYVTVSKENKDIYISTQVLRQTALQGDVVLIFIKKPEQNTQSSSNEIVTTSTNDKSDKNENENEMKYKKQGFVILILEKIHPRECVGVLKCTIIDDKRVMMIHPRDARIPNIRISEANGLRSFRGTDSKNFTDKLYLVKLLDWQNNIPNGKILEEIGKCGDLEIENKAILLSNSFDPKPFSEEILDQLPKIPYQIPEHEFSYREDLRKLCIFTIDPSTACDLDDAVSCRLLDTNNYEIGVHISDVSYFIKENSLLDEKIQDQATSIYMIDCVYHMIPPSLCLICSLLPGEDKLAFSVFWEMTKNGEIINKRFCRSIINSCAKLSYEHAQLIIENPERTNFDNDNFPEVFNGYNVIDLANVINQLQSIAIKLREKRYDNGALRLDQPKIYFNLNENGRPISFSSHLNKDSNRLIEEFMLLANGTVAEFIHSKFDNIAILRNHFPPLNLDKLQEKFSSLGITFDSSTSKTIRNSIENIVEKSSNKEAALCILNHICARQMTRAGYFCSEEGDGDAIRWHYALSIPIYTHFTSPIRRYPDILVHRLLAAGLELTPVPEKTPEQLKLIVNNCNIKKYNAKLTSDDCINLYFIHYIKSIGKLKMRAAVLNIQEFQMELVLMETGHQVKFSYSTMKSTIEFQYLKYAVNVISKNSKFKTFQLKVFSECSVFIKVDSNNKLSALLAPSLINDSSNDEMQQEEIVNKEEPYIIDDIIDDYENEDDADVVIEDESDVLCEDNEDVVIEDDECLE